MRPGVAIRNKGKDRVRSFDVYVPEQYLHVTQPYLRGPNDLKPGQFCCMPGHNGELYRYQLKSNTLGRFAEIQTLDKYSQFVPSGCLTTPISDRKYNESIAEVHTTGLQLFQTITLARGTVFVSCLTKNGMIVVFDGNSHHIIPEKEPYEVKNDAKFSVGDDVTSPFSKFFDFGRIVHSRSVTKGKHVFWEHAVAINESKRQGVFYYPEAVLTLLPRPP